MIGIGNPAGAPNLSYVRGPDNSAGSVSSVISGASLVQGVITGADLPPETDSPGLTEAGSAAGTPFSDTEIVQVSDRLPLVVSVDRRVTEQPEGDTFGVTSVTFAGDTIFSREFSYTPVPMAQTLVDSLVEARASGVADSPFPSAPTADRAAVWARNTLYTPAFHPPVSQLVIGRDGSLWLGAERVGGPTVSWRIISPQGDPVGSVELPARFTPLLVDGNRVWGSWYDELDVPYILRYWIGLPSDAPDRIRLGG